MVRRLAERMWSNDPRLLSKDSVSPVHDSAALLELEELQPGLAFLMTFGNVTALDTSDGLVLIDCGAPMVAPFVLDGVREWCEKPLHTCIYTHGHVDHVFGVKAFEAEAEERGWPRARVVAHANVPARFDRYKMTRGYNSIINSRQFQVKVDWPMDYRYPDVTYTDALTLNVGAETLELHHAVGETDDATWVFIPARRVLCTGDFFIWAAPNCGNPQKVQRYPVEWAKTLRQMAAKEAELLLPGHGPPIFGAKRVAQALGDAATFLERVVEHTLAGINAGKRLGDIVHSLPPMDDLLTKAYLRPTYDDPRFIVSNLWRLYCGWWDQDPATLLPPSEVKLAEELAATAGGAHALAERAAACCHRGDVALAARLVEWALAAAPADAKDPIAARRRADEVRAQVYEAREKQETSLMAQSIFRAAKLESRERLDGGSGASGGAASPSSAASAIESDGCGSTCACACSMARRDMAEIVKRHHRSKL